MKTKFRAPYFLAALEGSLFTMAVMTLMTAYFEKIVAIVWVPMFGYAIMLLVITVYSANYLVLGELRPKGKTWRT